MIAGHEVCSTTSHQGLINRNNNSRCHVGFHTINTGTLSAGVSTEDNRCVFVAQKEEASFAGVVLCHDSDVCSSIKYWGLICRSDYRR